MFEAYQYLSKFSSGVFQLLDKSYFGIFQKANKYILQQCSGARRGQEGSSQGNKEVHMDFMCTLIQKHNWKKWKKWKPGKEETWRLRFLSFRLLLKSLSAYLYPWVEYWPRVVNQEEHYIIKGTSSECLVTLETKLLNFSFMKPIMAAVEGSQLSLYHVIERF